MDCDEIIDFVKWSFFININVFRPLKLEIALAIPTSNDEKHEDE